MILALCVIFLGPTYGEDDRISSALWYAKQTNAQLERLGESVEKINDRIGALVEDSAATRGRIERVEDRVSRHEATIAEQNGTLRSLELWRSESTGKLAVVGGVFAIVMGYAMSIFNRFLAKRDKRRGHD